MAYDAVALTSKEYCPKCGSFDLVSQGRSAIGFGLAARPADYHCFGCNRAIQARVIEENRLKVLPTHPGAYFLPPKRRRQVRPSKPLKPITALVGITLITGAIYLLFSYSPAVRQSSPAFAELEWVEAESMAVSPSELDVLEALTVQFNQVVKAKKNPAQ